MMWCVAVPHFGWLEVGVMLAILLLGANFGWMVGELGKRKRQGR